MGCIDLSHVLWCIVSCIVAYVSCIVVYCLMYIVELSKLLCCNVYDIMLNFLMYCFCCIDVSYTHLTLPTNREV